MDQLPAAVKDYYNHEHRHSGIAFLTPADVHYGRTDAVLAAREVALGAAYAAHPERFVHGRPIPKRPPSIVYINEPPLPAVDRPRNEPEVHVLTDISTTEASELANPPLTTATQFRRPHSAKSRLH